VIGVEGEGVKEVDFAVSVLIVVKIVALVVVDVVVVVDLVCKRNR
jgi:hypothetical protein